MFERGYMFQTISCQVLWVYTSIRYVYIYAIAAWKWTPASSQRFQVEATSRIFMPRKALMFRDWGRIGNNSEDVTYTISSHWKTLSWLKTLQSPIDVGEFFGGRTCERLISLTYPYQGKDSYCSIFTWYLQPVGKFYDPYRLWNPLPETENSIEILCSGNDCTYTLQECRL